MRNIKTLKVPTGEIYTADGEKGRLEFLSVGDYGKENNIYARFLGEYAEGINPDAKIKPLEEKWVITISTQYGCKIGCSFCDVPKVKYKGNATFKDLIHQIITPIQLHKEIEYTERLNIHFARMGEPSYNPNVLDAGLWIYEHLSEYHPHPVVSTMMPKDNEWLKTFIHTWMRLKNRRFKGEAGLQLSINSTSDKERDVMFNGRQHKLEDIAKIMEGIIPNGRKIALNFAVADWEINPDVLLKYFDPEYFMVKLTPIHINKACRDKNIQTDGNYTQLAPYKEHEERLYKAGYDTLVFFVSPEEDEGRITCGNAILSDKQ